MKKILIGMNILSFGGVAKSLLNLINFLKDKYKITLLLFRGDGNLMSELPEDVEVIITDDYMATFVAGLNNCKNLGFKRYLFKFFMGCYSKIFKTNTPFLKYALKKSKRLKGFDYAISYTKVVNRNEPWAGMANFIINNVEADKKLLFFHEEYNERDFNKYTINIYNHFDKIFAVSKSVKNQICSNVPQLKDKFDFIYNFCDEKEILKKADKKIQLSNTLNLITVARLSPEKGVYRILEALSRINKEGYKFCYNIVGDGLERKNIENFIKENKMEDCVKLWGYKENPYPFIASADLMICGSFKESFGISLVESMILGVPVLSTKTISANEIVGDKGFICENSTEGIYESLLEIIKNKKLLDDKKIKLQNYKFENDEIVSKFAKVFAE